MRTLIFLCFTMVLVSCDKNLVDSQSIEFENAKWPIKVAPVFDITPPDTLNSYDLFLNLRNSKEYAYSNLFLISEIKFPQGKIVTDTLEYEMATPQGEYLGSSRGSVVENKLWLKEGVRFRESGTYQLTVRHIMRDARSVEGMAHLNGVLDIGYSIEKPMNHGDN